jgi:hypothetical protein
MINCPYKRRYKNIISLLSGLHGEDSEHSVRHDFLGTYSGKKEKRTELILKQQIVRYIWKTKSKNKNENENVELFVMEFYF